jgi:hypothetical protein
MEYKALTKPLCLLATRPEMRRNLDEARCLGQIDGGIADLTAGTAQRSAETAHRRTRPTLDKKIVFTSGLCWNHCKIRMRSVWPVPP